MTQSLHPAAKRGFSASAELYQQVRPDYPAEISQWLADTLTLPVDARLLDLGSGTGRISVAIKGEFRLRLSAEELESILTQEMM